MDWSSYCLQAINTDLHSSSFFFIAFSLLEAASYDVLMTCLIENFSSLVIPMLHFFTLGILDTSPLQQVQLVAVSLQLSASFLKM